MKTRLRWLDLRGRMIPIAAFLVGAGHAIAGDVKCVEVNGTLFVEGSAGADSIDVRTAPDGTSILVIGAPGTTVNGSLDVASFGGIESVRIAMKDGDNVVSCSHLVLDGDLRYQGGKKTDALTIEQCSVDGMVKVATGAGNDTVIVDGSTVVDQLRLDGSAGDDDFRILDSTTGPVRSNLGADRGGLLINGSEIGRLDLEASNQDEMSGGIFGTTIHGDLDAKLGARRRFVLIARVDRRRRREMEQRRRQRRREPEGVVVRQRPDRADRRGPRSGRSPRVHRCRCDRGRHRLRRRHQTLIGLQLPSAVPSKYF